MTNIALDLDSKKFAVSTSWTILVILPSDGADNLYIFFFAHMAFFFSISSQKFGTDDVPENKLPKLARHTSHVASIWRRTARKQNVVQQQDTWLVHDCGGLGWVDLDACLGRIATRKVSDGRIKRDEGGC